LLREVARAQSWRMILGGHGKVEGKSVGTLLELFFIFMKHENLINIISGKQHTADFQLFI